MATATKSKKKRAKRVVKVEEKALEISKTVEAPRVIETCFYCRESKYEPSTTGCPVGGHTRKR